MPKALEDALQAYLAKGPGGRPQNASDLAERPSSVELVTPWTRRRAERW